MALNTNSVSKSLDRKLKIFGFEIPDLIAIFLTLSLLNFLFSEHPYKVLVSLGPTVILGAVIRIGKRGKPDNYLLHFMKFKLSPKYFSAFLKSSQDLTFKRKDRK